MSMKHLRQTGRLVLPARHGTGQRLSMHRMQKICPHALQCSLVEYGSRGVEQQHSLRFWNDCHWMDTCDMSCTTCSSGGRNASDCSSLPSVVGTPWSSEVVQLLLINLSDVGRSISSCCWISRNRFSQHCNFLHRDNLPYRWRAKRHR